MKVRRRITTIKGKGQRPAKLRDGVKIATALGAIAMVAGFLAPGSAAAATAGKEATSASFTLQAETATPGPSASRNAAPSIRPGTGALSPDASTTCTLSIDNPHHSTHVPGTANVETHVSCTAPVSSIDLVIYLFDLTRGRAEEDEFYNAGEASLDGNVAIDPCISGDYEGLAETTVTWPPGFTPSPQTWDVESPIVAVPC